MDIIGRTCELTTEIERYASHSEVSKDVAVTVRHLKLCAHVLYTIAVDELINVPG
jgi:hypothetical protein